MRFSRTLIMVAMSTSLLVGCSKTENEKALDKVLAKTGVSSVKRTTDWYLDNPFDRQAVLQVCSDMYDDATDHYYDKPENQDIKDEDEAKKRQTEFEDMYKKVPDCWIAYQAELQKDNLPGMSQKVIDTNVVEDASKPSLAPNDMHTEANINSVPQANTELDPDAQYDQQIAQYSASVAKALNNDPAGKITDKDNKALSVYTAKGGKLDQIAALDDKTLAKADDALFNSSSPENKKQPQVTKAEIKQPNQQTKPELKFSTK